MCVIVSLAMVVPNAGVTGAELGVVVGADSRMSAMLGNMRKT